MEFLETLSTQLIPQARAILPTLPWGVQVGTMLGAMGLQESGGQDIQQVGGGPGLGYWQEEAGIGAVLRNASSAAMARHAVEASGILEFEDENHSRKSTDPKVPAEIPYGPGGGYPSMTVPLIVMVMRRKFLNFPVLQTCFARLMLWDNPNPLPSQGDCNGAWTYYTDTWRPGTPRPATWRSNYSQSLAHFQGNAT